MGGAFADMLHGGRLAVGMAGILVGADSMSRAVGVPTYIADVIVAVSLITIDRKSVV